MRKIVVIVSIIAGYSYGMDCPRESEIASSDKTMFDVQDINDSDEESMYSAKDGQGSPEPIKDWQGSSESMKDWQGSPEPVIIKSLSRTVTIDITDPTISEKQSIGRISFDDDTEDSISQTSSLIHEEGRFGAVVRKVFQPLQIASSASTIMLITAAEAVRNAYPSVSIGLSYGALGSAVTSGILSLFIAETNRNTSSLNKVR